ncbi:1,4-alpha-glucan branching enzyme [Francisella halioticida]|uniref:1,4-alpha-glucan branching enzyme GlgB n=1 Tax=Francisella halioticida TaxID=549298 RepID=A0ABM6M2D5_9GAMM|nr:1,4-alpha-glucan branching protein GlgB [Francisella halioticida]ASG69039.1 1,4-alpha-glucan branching enzyme [Francisella halioticida]
MKKLKQSFDTNTHISDLDKCYFHEGKHIYAYNFMGAHKAREDKVTGIRFTTWAPNAKNICVIGDFSFWGINDKYYMKAISELGLWSIFIPEAKEGDKYKFVVTNKDTNQQVHKSDPYAVLSELRPSTASIINTKTKYKWHDDKWLKKRAKVDYYQNPINTYELHLASWKTKDDEFMSYDEIAETLPKYVKEMGYTHVEFMPLHEHPLDASWGYQPTGFYSVNSRHGDSVGLKRLIDKLHNKNIGVILDWVPGHFCKDLHGLINFDGSACYEYQNYNKAENKGWGTKNFDLGRSEVKCFLISNAMYWINEFHIDGIRVDAVSNILYLNYDREDGQWEPNIYGGHENLEGATFLKELNSVLKHTCKGALTIAEESSSWPDISTPVEDGGLGFDFKWNMGWMNDTLRYIALDPVYRKYHHNLITFSMVYHYSEKFILSISHDEVVHGKKSLINKMWGDLWNKYAGLRLYMTYMIGHPGKKLIFMGSEFGQFVEWREYEQLQWQVVDEYDAHKQTLTFFKELNDFYRRETALWECDYDHQGFNWIDANNSEQSILSFVRNDKAGNHLIFICNFTPEVYYNYHLGVPRAGSYKEVFNSDELKFGGSGQIIENKIFTEQENLHSFDQRLSIKIPPMATLVLKPVAS